MKKVIFFLLAVVLSFSATASSFNTLDGIEKVTIQKSDTINADDVFVYGSDELYAVDNYRALGLSYFIIKDSYKSLNDFCFESEPYNLPMVIPLENEIHLIRIITISNNYTYRKARDGLMC